MANALQAVLDKAAKGEGQAKGGGAQPARSARPAAPRSRRAPETEAAASSPAPSPPAAAGAGGRRPVREGKRFVGAHVEPEVARQLKMIAAEDDTTIQDLLEEALDLLFAKKGKAAMVALARRAG